MCFFCCCRFCWRLIGGRGIEAWLLLMISCWNWGRVYNLALGGGAGVQSLNVSFLWDGQHEHYLFFHEKWHSVASDPWVWRMRGDIIFIFGWIGDLLVDFIPVTDAATSAQTGRGEFSWGLTPVLKDWVCAAHTHTNIHTHTGRFGWKGPCDYWEQYRCLSLWTYRVKPVIDCLASCVCACALMCVCAHTCEVLPCLLTLSLSPSCRNTLLEDPTINMSPDQWFMKKQINCLELWTISRNLWLSALLLLKI